MVYLCQHRLVFLLDGRRHLPYQTSVERNPHQDQGRQRTDGEIQIDGRTDADTAEKFRQFFLCHSASSSAILSAAVFRRRNAEAFLEHVAEIILLLISHLLGNHIGLVISLI